MWKQLFEMKMNKTCSLLNSEWGCGDPPGSALNANIVKKPISMVSLENLQITETAMLLIMMAG